MRSTDSRCVLALLALLALLPGCKDEVVVVVEVATVEVQGPALLVAGETAQFTAIPRDDQGNRLTNRPISWTTSSGTLASVSSSGMVTGVLGGAVAITANCEGKGGSAELQVNNPVPAVTSTDPSVLDAGGGAVQLRVLGSGFVSTSVVRWNGTDRVTTFVSGTEVRAAILESDLASPGDVQLVVTNPAPGGGSSAGRALNVSNPVPVVDALSPDNMVTGNAGEVLLTVIGTGFHGASVVRWEGNPIPTAYVSGSKLEATIPAGEVVLPGYRTVTVSNPPPGGGESQGRTLTVWIYSANLPKVDGGSSHTCALADQGRAYCWGRNNGALGSGGTEDADQPVEVAGGLRFVTVATGAYHGCALDEVGRAYCWGNGWSGALGDGTNTDRLAPVPVSGGLHFVRIAAGDNHTCGLTWGGEAYCWGWNASGQLGDGTTINRPAPVAVQQGGTRFASLVGGGQHTCAVAAWGGPLYCWGNNDAGQLGDNTLLTRTTPVPVVGLSQLAAVAAGSAHTCAATNAGVGYCWGLNAAGQLGDGTTTNSSTPVPLFGAPSVSRLTAGDLHTCGILGAAGVHCWGGGLVGQLGNGGRSHETRPAKVAVLGSVQEIAAGSYHSCAREADGDLHCWGDLGHGQIGNGSAGIHPEPLPVQGGPGAWSRVSSGNEFTCALSATGAPHCWGENVDGQLGDGTLLDSRTPVSAVTAKTLLAVGSGYGHACGLTSGGEALCWGWGETGALGNGSWIDAPAPTPVSGGLIFSSIAVGSYHTCGLSGTTVYCWGDNRFGKLGDGTSTDRNAPTPVAIGGVGLIFSGVAAGGNHSCAITAPFGGVSCWGQNLYGQLGNGTTAASLTPVTVPGLLGIVAVSLGQYHSCALDASGQAWCWGFNDYGSLGNGGATSSTVPVAVAGGRLFRSIHANRYHTCAVSLDDRGYCWGSGGNGQLGLGALGGAIVPTEIVGGRLWAELSGGASQQHTCGVTTGGQLLCWGQQLYGELGNGEWGVQLQPSLVLGGHRFGS